MTQQQARDSKTAASLLHSEATPSVIKSSTAENVSAYPLDFEKHNRLSDLDTFIRQQGLNGDLTVFEKDMSNRQYYRLKTLDKKFIVMDAPAPEKPAKFVLLADFLIKHGLRAPQILGFNETKGFVLLEDFGDKTFTRVLEAAEKIGDDKLKMVEKRLYETATDILHSLKKCQKPMAIEDYTVEKLLVEVEIFIDWYWLYAKGVPAPAIAKEPFMTLWQDLFNSMPPTPKTFVIRDFHVDNLMIIDEPLSIKTCGVLDFQDALWGSVVYDFISLLEDARRDVSEEVVQQCSKKFLATYPADQHKSLEITSKILAAGRHVKVIGIFTRYALRQNNDSKCVHLPRLWRYLEQHFKDPIFAPIADWFNTYFPLHLQHKVVCNKPDSI